MGQLFISHSTRDGGVIARELAQALEAAGRPCWIAPRDVRPGIPYPGQIVSAIEASDGLVLIVTAEANASPDVLQEVQLASAARKIIAPVIAGGAAPSPDIRYYIGVRHQIPWSDARATANDLLRSFPGSAVAPAAAPAPAPAAASSELVDVLMLSPGSHKIELIKCVRRFSGGGLAETKLLVEGAPPVLLGHAMPREQATEFERELQELGARVQLKAVKP